jgi:hypothetical protein
MRKAAAPGRKPGNEKGRRAGRPNSKLNIHSNSATADSTTTLRLQRLAGIGVGGSSAMLMASLIWGTDGGNSLIGGAL